MKNFSDYIAEHVGTHKWVVAPFLTERLCSDGYDHAISHSRFHTLQVGFERETQAEALRLATQYYRDYGISLLDALTKAA